MVNAPASASEADVVSAARDTLGQVGVLLPQSFTAATPLIEQRDAVRRLEEAGFTAAWGNERIGGKDTLVQLALLLSATERIVFGTSVMNIWARAPQTAHSAAAMLAQSYPRRLILGMGVGYPQQAAAVGREFVSPVRIMRTYLETMTTPGSPPFTYDPAAITYPRLVGANGPNMLALARDAADGAVPSGWTPEFTAEARRVLGPGKLLVMGITLIPDADKDRAWKAARDSVALLLAVVPDRAKTLRRLGYTERDITEVSDRLVNAMVAYGEPAAIRAKVEEHLAAGADHVAFLPAETQGDQEQLDLLRIAPVITDVERP